MSSVLLDWPRIKTALDELDVVTVMTDAFRAYSAGMAVIPPVGELAFDQPPGDVHIKYGYLQDGQFYVVKIASGFYDNPQVGLPSSQGLMLLSCKRTGVLKSILLDDGRLTDIRTGAAGAVAARYLAPKDIHCIGVIGSGIQARRQLEFLAGRTGTRRVMAWGRDNARLAKYLEFGRHLGFKMSDAGTLERLVRHSQLIVTTTPSIRPLVKRDWVQPGTHITAVGSDTPEKQELDPELIESADVLVVDSLSQCVSRGELHRSLSAGRLSRDRVMELGHVIAGRALGRKRQTDISIADLTGVAVQDLAIARSVYRFYLEFSQRP